MDAAGIERWQGRTADDWRQRWGVPELRLFRRVGSTNDVAKEMARDGAAEGTLVLADEQTAGRGRRGRSWSAPAGSSLSLSMVLRPGEGESTRVLTLRLGLAAARAIETVLPLDLQLKWPNDLGIDGRKVGGILCEGDVMDDRIIQVIAGIGINLRQTDDDWPDDLAGTATSLGAAAGTDVDTAAVTSALVDGWLEVARHPRPQLSETELQEFARRDALEGHRIAIDDEPAGTAAGVAPDGALRVRESGRLRDVLAGTVRPL